jgi:hypothetical protein
MPRPDSCRRGVGAGLARPTGVVAAIAAAVVLLGAGTAPAAVTAPVYDAKGRLVDTPFAQPTAEPELDEKEAIQIALANPKIRDWVERYPQDGLTKTGDFDDESGVWTIKVWSDLPKAGQIVLARVEDATGRVTEAWTGPQVAWGMARGYKGLFGRQLNEPWFWFPFCVLFFVGLADLRRLRSLRNLDLLVLLSFTVSWWFFNRGEPFTSVPLFYPPLVYFLARMAWVGFRGRPARESRPVWPVWVLVAATVFLLGFRTTLNLTATQPNVIDVGYAGVVGAQRIVGEGQSPYGHFPVEEGDECGPADSYGRVRDRVQTNGRCESAIGNGDTYGPITYLAYIPGYLIFGWEGKWDELPAAHFTTLLVDGLVIVGLALVGRRFGGTRLAATLAFGWAAFPFTQYVSNTNSNDAIMPLLLVWGFLFVSSAPVRGFAVGLAGWAKFAALLLVPLWASFPNGLKRPRALVLFAAGFALATLLAFWVLLLEPDPLHAARVFWDRTFGYQLDRDAPWSLWDWGVYPGYPDLKIVQQVLQVVAIAAALAVGFVPRRKTPLQLAALTAAILVVFQLTLSYWFYTYIPWFVPFVLFALFAPALRAPEEPVPPEHDRETRELVGAPS